MKIQEFYVFHTCSLNLNNFNTLKQFCVSKPLGKYENEPKTETILIKLNN